MKSALSRLTNLSGNHRCPELAPQLLVLPLLSQLPAPSTPAAAPVAAAPAAAAPAATAPAAPATPAADFLTSLKHRFGHFCSGRLSLSPSKDLPPAVATNLAWRVKLINSNAIYNLEVLFRAGELGRQPKYAHRPRHLSNVIDGWCFCCPCFPCCCCGAAPAAAPAPCPLLLPSAAVCGTCLTHVEWGSLFYAWLPYL